MTTPSHLPLSLATLTLLTVASLHLLSLVAWAAMRAPLSLRADHRVRFVWATIGLGAMLAFSIGPQLLLGLREESFDSPQSETAAATRMAYRLAQLLALNGYFLLQVRTRPRPPPPNQRQ